MLESRVISTGKPKLNAYAPSRVTTSEYEAAFSRRVSPDVCIFVLSLSNSEGAGKTGCSLHPRSRVQFAHKKRAHEHTGSAEAFRPSLRNGFTAYNVISPENGSFASVIGGSTSRQLNASTAASEPHDFAVRLSHTRQS